MSRKPTAAGGCSRTACFLLAWFFLAAASGAWAQTFTQGGTYLPSSDSRLDDWDRPVGVGATTAMPGLGRPTDVAPAVAARQKLPRITHPILRSGYDAARNQTLATQAAGPITERDFLIYRLMRREQDPALYHTWEKAGGRSREQLGRQLEAALKEYAFTTTLGAQESAEPTSPADLRFIRYLKYPVYQWVWIERVLKPGVKAEDIDLIKYYRDNPEQYYRPEQVRVRYVFRDVPARATVAEREAREREMEIAREKIAGGGDFGEVASQFSDAPSAARGGELPPFRRGVFVPEFESPAFELEQPGEISPVVRGPGGLYLIQLIERIPEEQIPFRKVLEQVREAAERKTLAYLYSYELNRLVMYKNQRRSWGFNLLEADDVLVKVSHYDVTKGAFLRMFPFVISYPVQLNEFLVYRLVEDILRGELVAQRIEEMGLQNDPLLVQADEIARRIWGFGEAQRKAMAVPLTFNEETVRAFYQKHQDELSYLPQWRVFRFDAAVRNPFLRHPSQLPALRAEMREQFQEVLSAFHTAVLEERVRQARRRASEEEQEEYQVPLDAAALPEEGVSTASAALRKQLLAIPASVGVIPASSNVDYQYLAVDEGYLNPNSPTYKSVRDLQESEVGPIFENRTGGYSAYFVERHIPGTAADYEAIRPHVRQQYITNVQRQAMERLRDETMRQSGLRIEIPGLKKPER